MMSQKLQARILERLEQAERDLLGIVSEAAKTADYAAIDTARTVASALRRLREELRADEARPIETPPLRKVGAKSNGRERTRQRPAKAKAGYPKFYVRDDSLIKEGWSKKSNRAYTHRVPADAYRRAIAALQQAGGNDERPLTTDVLRDDSNLDAGNSLPTYQFYVVLAFLKANGVIRQVGRKGYVIPGDLEENAIEIWKQQSLVKRGS